MLLSEYNKLDFKSVEEVVLKDVEKLLKSVSVEQITNAVLNFRNIEDDDYCKLSAFKDGKSAELDKEGLIEDLQLSSIIELNNMSYSLRVTNIQKLIPQIKEAVILIFKKYGLACACNMYFTPNKNNNCFVYHSDYQETLIYQVYGEKTWVFPLDEDNKYLRVPNFRFPGYSPKKTFKKIFKPGSLHSVSHSLLHRAFLEGKSPSIHLTFGIEQKKDLDFMRKIIEGVLSKNLELLLTSPFSKDGSKKQVESFLEQLSSIDLDKESAEFCDIADKESIRLVKNGRKY